MTALAFSTLTDDALRSQLGQALLAARKARYLSIDDVASSLNMMPCHVRLIESAQYDPRTQHGMFSELVEKYSQFADVRMDQDLTQLDLTRPGRDRVELEEPRPPGLLGFPPFVTAALMAGVMVLAVFVPFSKMASNTTPQFERIAFEPLLLEPAAGAYHMDDSAILNSNSATDPLSSTEKPQFALDEQPTAATVGVAQHEDDNAGDPGLVNAALADLNVPAAEQEEPASYPVMVDSEDVSVPEVISFIEGLRSLADRG